MVAKLPWQQIKHHNVSSNASSGPTGTSRQPNVATTDQTHYNVIDENCQHSSGLQSNRCYRGHVGVSGWAPLDVPTPRPGHLLYLSQLPITANFMACQPVSCSIAIAVNCLTHFFASSSPGHNLLSTSDIGSTRKLWKKRYIKCLKILRWLMTLL